jgi:hypothetical protein
MDSPLWFEALWAAPRAPENSMQSCLALNRNAAEMPAIKSGFDGSAAKKTFIYD